MIRARQEPLSTGVREALRAIGITVEVVACIGQSVRKCSNRLESVRACSESFLIFPDGTHAWIFFRTFPDISCFFRIIRDWGDFGGWEFPDFSGHCRTSVSGQRRTGSIWQDIPGGPVVHTVLGNFQDFSGLLEGAVRAKLEVADERFVGTWDSLPRGAIGSSGDGVFIGLFVEG